jgi:hypothetical protein
MMKRAIKASIDILVPPETVWQVLMDFPNYPKWSKFLLDVDGKAIPGSHLHVVLMTSDSVSHIFKLMVLQVTPPRAFRWSGRMGVPGLFDGEHSFTLEYQFGGRTRVRQTGEFSGLLMPFLWPKFETPFTRGFTAFNRALKKRSESRH